MMPPTDATDLQRPDAAPPTQAAAEAASPEEAMTGTISELEAANVDAIKRTAPYQALQDQYLRLAADFENFRKRNLQEFDQARRAGLERVIQELLPVLDNLDRATASLSEQSDPKLLFQSFRLMHNQLMEGLGNVGLQPYRAEGQPFDPNRHEAVSQEESVDHPENTVIKQLQSGFMLDDRVLRPALVTVSTGGGAAPPSKPEAATKQQPLNPFVKASGANAADAGGNSATAG
jgi:molecular chaperone GrpE